MMGMASHSASLGKNAKYIRCSLFGFAFFYTFSCAGHQMTWTGMENGDKLPTQNFFNFVETL